MCIMNFFKKSNLSNIKKFLSQSRYSEIIIKDTSIL